MKVNLNCMSGEHVKIFLNGKQLTNCLEANDEEGFVWVVREAAKNVPYVNLRPGDFIHDDHIVDRLTGKVEITFDESKFTEAALRENARQSFIPLYIVQFVQ